MAMRTMILKLHEPGRRKREIIDDAMLKYTLAYQFLLDKASDRLEEITERYKGTNGGFSSKNIANWVRGDIGKELNKYGVECFKDSLKVDFSMTMASFLELREVRSEVGYPVAYLTKEKWEENYQELTDKLMDGQISSKEYEREVLKLNEKSMALKPIFFCRCAENRDFCLLYDQNNDRYYAKLYLMNVKSQNRSPIAPNAQKHLRHVHKDGTILETGRRRERFIIVPLSFGCWQEEHIKKALESPEIIKTARLVKRGNDYYLSVNILIEDAVKIKTSCFMGVARGIKHPVNYTIVDSAGETVTSGSVGSYSGIDYSNIAESEIHKLANAIVDVAKRNKAKVITQPFINIGDKLRYVDDYGNLVVPALSCNSYNKLNSILKYKVTGSGLPPPVETSPSGIFQTCPVCGLNSSQNRFKKDTLICIACGTAMDVELLGGLNLARRLLKYDNMSIEVKVEKSPDGIRFINEDLGLDYSHKDPMNFLDEFKIEIDGLVRNFYDTINERVKEKNFKRVFGMIKRIENAEDFTKLLRVSE